MSSKSGPPVHHPNPPPVLWPLLSYHHFLHCGHKIVIGTRFVQNYRGGHIREVALNASGFIVVKVSIQGEGGEGNILAQLGRNGEELGAGGYPCKRQSQEKQEGLCPGEEHRFNLRSRVGNKTCNRR